MLVAKYAAVTLSIAVLSIYCAKTVTAQKPPEFNSYRSVTLGMTKDAVRNKLGKPKNEFTDEDDFEISDSEFARVFYTANSTVRAIVITYTGDLSKAPNPKSVVGEAVEVTAEGNAYKMVRFPEAGYWASYLRMGGDKPSITITLHYLPKSTS
ncbi:MAG: hypothetical protein C4325_04890 [Blastocatellia bacterium]